MKLKKDQIFKNLQDLHREKGNQKDHPTGFSQANLEVACPPDHQSGFKI